MYDRILVPVDGSAAAERGLAEAIAIARGRGSTLLVLHVLASPPMYVGLTAVPALDETLHRLHDSGQALLDEAVRRAGEQNVQASTCLLDGIGQTVADVILEQASRQSADLIVMGTHGRRGLNRLALGSDAELVARSSPVPVLLVRKVVPPEPDS